MNHRGLRGTIRYTSAKPEHLGAERRREFFTITEQGDGTRVLHAHCEIDDAPDVIRDALHFRYVDTAGQLPEEHPVYDVWCSEPYLFLKGGVGGYMQTRYELVQLEGSL